MKTIVIVCAAMMSMMAAANMAYAASVEAEHPHQMEWKFDGVFGRFDKPAIQRGFQVYKEVCSACHSIKRLPFRQLGEVGFSDAEIKSLAASYTVSDGPNDLGDMFERPGRPSDRIPAPFPNEQAARSANNGAYPPDMSLLIKARHDGANYIYSLLTSYDEPMPEGMEVPEGKHHNPFMAGQVIAMAAPLHDVGQVEYQDGTEATVEQMSKDVVNFLQWVAEPEMEQRKRMGIKVIIFLSIMTGLFYVAKKRIWSRLH